MLHNLRSFYLLFLGSSTISQVICATWAIRQRVWRLALKTLSFIGPLSMTCPKFFIPDLVNSLDTLSEQLGHLNCPPEALKVNVEGVWLYCTLFHDSPKMCNSQLAMSLKTLSHQLCDLGHHREGLKVITEAVEI
jgi:hypothetical protein